MIKDSAVPGFTSIDETEIPLLQEHCKQLTEAGRASLCRSLLNRLNQLRTSLSLWASDDRPDVKLTDETKASGRAFLMCELQELEKSIERYVADTVKDMNDSLQRNIYRYFQPAITAASEAAILTVQKWGAHYDKAGSGTPRTRLHAVVRAFSPKLLVVLKTSIRI